MSAPAIRQNVDNWSSLFASHIETVKKRSASALAAAGYDALLLHAGTPPLIFLDDHHLPFRPHAPFKVWGPPLAPAGAFQGVGPAPRCTGFLPVVRARQEAAAADQPAGGLLAPVAVHPE